MQHMNNDTEYDRKLKSAMEDFIHHVYDVTEDFPKNEIFGITSQLRRVSLSVPLNPRRVSLGGGSQFSDNF